MNAHTVSSAVVDQQQQLQQRQQQLVQPPPRRSCCSGRCILAWIFPFVMGTMVFGSCAASNTYMVLLWRYYPADEVVGWRFPFCCAALCAQLVVFVMAFWGFFAVMCTNAGFVQPDPWAYVPIPGGPVPPSRALMKFFYSERTRAVLSSASSGVSLLSEEMEQDKLKSSRDSRGGTTNHNQTGRNVDANAFRSPTAATTTGDVAAHQGASGGGPPTSDGGGGVINHNSRRSHNENDVDVSAAPHTAVMATRGSPEAALLPSFLPSLEAWPTPNKYVVQQREIPRGGLPRLACHTNVMNADPNAPPQRGLVTHEEEEELRYCAACRLYKPDYARHCKQCGRCVYHFDHHCPFVNNCIGRNNYRMFVSFTLYGTLCGIYIPLMFVAMFLVDRRPFSRKSSWLAVPIIEIPLWFFLSVLFWQHVVWIHLAIHSVDLTVMRGLNIKLNNIDMYYAVQHQEYAARKAEFDQELYGSQHAWWKFLAPIPIRRDNSADTTP